MADDAPKPVVDYESAETAPTRHVLSDWGFVLLQQGAGALFASLILDGGGLLITFLVAVGFYWTIAIVLVVRRRAELTPVERFAMNIGFWPLWGLVGLVILGASAFDLL